MRFAKLFDIDDTQLLCVLQPREEDGVPEIKMITYVGNACIVLGNRVSELDDAITDPADLMARTRAVFDGFGQSEAEQAYRMAKQLLVQSLASNAALGALPPAQGARAGDSADAPQPQIGDTDDDFGVPTLSTAIH